MLSIGLLSVLASFWFYYYYFFFFLELHAAAFDKSSGCSFSGCWWFGGVLYFCGSVYLRLFIVLSIYSVRFLWVIGVEIYICIYIYI